MRGVLTDYFLNVKLTFERGWRHSTLAYCETHRHSAFEIVLHSQGTGTTRDSNRKTTPFEEGGITVYLPNTGHDQTMAGPGEDVCVHVGSDLTPPSQLPGTFYVPPGNKILRNEIELLAANIPSVTPLQQLAYDHRAAALLIELVQTAQGHADTEESGGDRYAALAHDYVRENLRSVAHLTEVAEALGISYDYLRHCFRQRYGISLKHWHTTVRVERAKDLLAHSNLPLKVIAELCGFANARYFSTCFRHTTHTTPATYRHHTQMSAPSPQ